MLSGEEHLVLSSGRNQKVSQNRRVEGQEDLRPNLGSSSPQGSHIGAGGQEAGHELPEPGTPPLVVTINTWQERTFIPTAQTWRLAQKHVKEAPS